MTDTLTDGAGTRLPAPARQLLGADAISAIGAGLTQPYLLVLLHTTYGLSLTAATATASVSAVVSLVGNPLSGILTDRFGGRTVMAGGLASVLAGLLTLSNGQTTLAAVAGVALTGFGWSLVLPALATLIAGCVAESQRARAFTLQYALFNAGLGTGAALGGLVIADPDRLPQLPRLWLFAAVACVVSAGLVLTLRAPVPSADGSGHPLFAAAAAAAAGAGYRSVLADRALWRVLVVALGLSAAGYGVYAVGPSVLALTADDPAALAWVSVANCATVVLGLPLALRLARWMTPRTALRSTTAVWTVAWLLCAAEALGHGPGVRIALPAAAALIGAGELLMASAVPTLVNALAPQSLRGRYNALLTVIMTMGVWAGPALASVASWLGHGSLLFVAALAMLAVVGVVLRRPIGTPVRAAAPLGPEPVMAA